MFMCHVYVIVARCGTVTELAFGDRPYPGWRPPRTDLPRAIIFSAFSVDYSDEDNDAGFVEKLQSKLDDKDVSVWLDWLDRLDLVAGPLQKQIHRAVKLNDVVLLVLSKGSIESDWVEHKAKTARTIERRTKRNVLRPVSLDVAWKDKLTDVDWEHLARKNTFDFCKWKTKAFGGQFAKRLKGLKIDYQEPKP